MAMISGAHFIIHFARLMLVVEVAAAAAAAAATQQVEKEV